MSISISETGHAAVPDRLAVVVLGMHRSGTSALAGTVARLGLGLPANPLPSSDDNPEGFYESRVVVEVNYRILLAAQCTWAYCLRLNPDDLIRKSKPPDQQFLSGILDAEFRESGGFVLKDPRLCLTLPAWLPALHRTASMVRALIIVRHPSEVTRSIAARNALPEEQMAAVWLHHVLEAERASRGLRRAVLMYDDLLRDWRLSVTQAGQTAAIAWPRPITVAEAEINAFLSGSSRHHRADPGSAKVGPESIRTMVNDAWGAMRRLAGDPESPLALACLDHIRARFADQRLALSGDGAFPAG